MAEPCQVDVFCCPKAGNSVDEYEDAWSVRSVDADRYRFAVADGATESSFSRLWAALLVEAYTRGNAIGFEFLDQLDPLRRLWAHRVSKRPLPWYAAEKARSGAFAAFLGLELDATSRRWRALAVGDCNLFQLDGVRPAMRVVQAFPLTRSSDFGSSPFLLASRPDAGDLTAHRYVCEGALRGEDVVLLTSDAVSAWLLQRDEEGRPAWRLAAFELGEQLPFEALIDEARQDGMRNDDSTLVRIRFQAR